MTRSLGPLALLLALLAAGCGSVREVQTQPPRPAVAAPDTAAGRATLVVTLAITEPLPGDVAALRIRPTALGLKPADAPWERRPLAVGPVESGTRPTRLLTSEIAALRYDTLTLTLADPFVTFSPNAGGPLTLPDDGLVRLPLALDLSAAATDTLRLRLDAAASLVRDTSDCRWRFTPVVRVNAE